MFNNTLFGDWHYIIGAYLSFSELALLFGLLCGHELIQGNSREAFCVRAVQ